MRVVEGRLTMPVAVLGATAFLVAAAVSGRIPPIFVLALVMLALVSVGLARAWSASPTRRTRPHVTATLLAVQVAAFFAATPSLGSGRLKLDDLAFIGAVGVLIFDLRNHRRRPAVVVGPLVVGVVLIAAGGLIGNQFPPSKQVFRHALGYQGSSLFFLPAGIADVVRFIGVTAGMLLIVSFWRPNAKERWRVAAAFGAGGMASVAWGLLHGGVTNGRVEGLTTHPVYYGLISSFVLIIGIGLASSSTGRARLYGFAVAFFGAMGVFGSGTRSSALIAGVAIVLFLLGARSVRVVGAFLAFALLGLLIMAVNPGTFGDSPTVQRFGGGGYSAYSDLSRKAVREDTYSLLRARGITGAGFKYIVGPHNLLLGVMAAAGLIGLIGLLIVVGALVRRFLTIDPNDRLSAAVMAGVLALFACFWVVNMGWGRWLWIPLALFAPARALPLGRRFEPVPDPWRREPAPVAREPAPMPRRVRREPMPVRREPSPRRREPLPIRAQPSRRGPPLWQETSPLRSDPAPPAGVGAPIEIERQLFVSPPFEPVAVLAAPVAPAAAVPVLPPEEPPEVPPDAPAEVPEEGRRRRFFQVASGFLGSQMVAVVTAPVLARSLSVSDRGTFGLILALSATLGLVATVGIPSGVIYYASVEGGRPPVSLRSFNRLLGIQMALAAALGAVVVLVCAGDAGLAAALFGAAAILPLTVTTNQAWLFLGLKRPRLYRRFSWMSSAVLVLGVVGVAATGTHNITVFAAMWAIVNWIPALIGQWWLFGRRGLWRPDTPHGDTAHRDIYRFGARALLGIIPPSENASVEILLATAILSHHARGLFVVATAFREPGRIIGGAITTYAAPEHARLDPQQQKRHQRQLLKLSGVAAVISSLGMAAIAPTAMRIAFGHKYAGGADAARVLALCGGISLLGRAARGLRFGEGRPGLNSLSEVASLIVLAAGIALPIDWTVARFAVLVLVAEIVRTAVVVIHRAQGSGRSSRASRRARSSA